MSVEPEELQHVKAQLDKYSALKSEEHHVTFKETSDLSVYEFLSCFECQMMRYEAASDTTNSSVSSSMFDSTASLVTGTNDATSSSTASTRTPVCSGNAMESCEGMSGPRSSTIRVHLQTGIHEAKMNRLGMC